jgi:beta-phosphoglucomutase-like phosphatase (HAD superfamily)
MIEILNNMLTNKNTLIFDLDGTIVNTDKANFLAYKEAIREIKNIDLSLRYSKNERLTRNKLKEVLPSLNNQEYKEIIEIKNTVYVKYLQETSINNSVLEIINNFSKTNRVILSTNSYKERADLILEYYNLTDAFDDKFYKNDHNKENNKFKYVIDYLKVDPSLAIVFENENSEIRQAKLAGIPSKNIIKL